MWEGARAKAARVYCGGAGPCGAIAPPASSPSVVDTEQEEDEDDTEAVAAAAAAAALRLLLDSTALLFAACRDRTLYMTPSISSTYNDIIKCDDSLSLLNRN